MQDLPIGHTVEIGILCEFRYGRMESQVHDG